MSENKTTYFCRSLFAGLAVLLTAIPAISQSGGQFKIEQAVIATGGGTSSGGGFAVAGTNSQ